MANRVPNGAGYRLRQITDSSEASRTAMRRRSAITSSRLAVSSRITAAMASGRCSPGSGHERDGERDGERVSVTMERRHLEQPTAVVGASGLHDTSIAVPVAITQPLGNDQIQRPADRLVVGPAEEKRRGCVPETRWSPPDRRSPPRRQGPAPAARVPCPRRRRGARHEGGPKHGASPPSSTGSLLDRVTSGRPRIERLGIDLVSAGRSASVSAA